MSRELDKVYEVYMDSSESAITRKTRERIQWIVTQTEGESVLDIGCSQGITSILLGRARKRVLAIDLEETLIRFAKQKLSGEAQDVKENVTFAAGDFLSFPLGTRTFDTILMTEVLEHVTDVERFLKKAAACAQSHTKFVITVPFGIHDHWDHKRTYYVASLAEQMEADFQITSLNFMGGGRWLGITAVLKNQNVQAKGCVIVPDKERMLQEEQVFYQRERQLLDENARVKRQIGDQKGKNEKLRNRNERLQEQNRQIQERGQWLQEQNAQLKARTAVLKRRVEVLDRRWKTASTRLETLQKNYTNLNDRYIQLSKSVLGRTALWVFRVRSFIRRKITMVYTKTRDLFCGTKDDSVIGPEECTQLQEPEFIKQEIEVEENHKEPKLKREEETGQLSFLQTFMKDTMIAGEVYEYSWPELYKRLRAEVCDENYAEKMKSFLDDLPESSGSRYFTKISLKVGMIADEFLYHTYKNAVECIYITPDNYKVHLDILLVVSTWHGLNNEWQGLGRTNNSDIRNKLEEIIKYQRERGAKIVFYSKEDPGNYYVFLDIARQCDYIFTTAEECIEQYAKDSDIKNIHVLEFAINPVYHNPVGTRKFMIDEVLFAGTWWNKKYPVRKEDMEEIFQFVLQAGKKLKIIDRNYSMEKPDYFYPEKYLKYVSPEIDHMTLQKLQRLYSYSININTCTQSNTMYASRVYEIQALGKAIISNHSIGMERKFPNIIVDTDGNAVTLLKSLKNDELYKIQMDGLRRVMTNETVYDRINTILECAGMEKVNWEKEIGIVANTDHLNSIRQCVSEQTYKNCLVIGNLSRDIYEKLDIITYWNAAYDYGKTYLEDMINGFKYTDCDFITKDAFYKNQILTEGVEHDYVDHVSDIYRTVFWTKNIAYEAFVNRDFSGITNGYSIDHLNLTVYA